MSIRIDIFGLNINKKATTSIQNEVVAHNIISFSYFLIIIGLLNKSASEEI